MSKKGKNAENINQKVMGAVVREVSAGVGQVPFQCLAMESPQEEIKKFRKWLKASENWRVHKGTVWNSDGIPFNGTASWGTDVTVCLGGHEHRFRILQIDRLGWRTFYAIPIGMVDKFTTLPGIDLSAGEIILIREMACELSRKRSISEKTQYILHPARPDLKENRAQWDSAELDFQELLRMMEDENFRSLVVVALAAHYRSFLPGADLPEGIYNFVIPPKGSASDLWFYTVLQALTFANAPGKNMAGPITVTMKEADDLARWRCCHERLAVIRTATGSLLWPLLEEIEEGDQLMRGGGAVPAPLPTVPISLTRSYLHHPQAMDILLPVEPPPVTEKQLDLLRAGMSRLLRRKIAAQAFQIWQQRRAQPAAYRTQGFADWHTVLLETCCAVWFPDPKYQSDRKEIICDTQRSQEEQQRAVSETLQRGIDLLTDPTRYLDNIIERPSSREEWKASIEDGALAFWFAPKSGRDTGSTFLVFTADTLKALLARAGCFEEHYEAFLNRCDALKLLDDTSRTIKLGKDQISAITFSIQRP